MTFFCFALAVPRSYLSFLAISVGNLKCCFDTYKECFHRFSARENEYVVRFTFPRLRLSIPQLGASEVSGHSVQAPFLREQKGRYSLFTYYYYLHNSLCRPQKLEDVVFKFNIQLTSSPFESFSYQFMFALKLGADTFSEEATFDATIMVILTMPHAYQRKLQIRYRIAGVNTINKPLRSPTVTLQYGSEMKLDQLVWRTRERPRVCLMLHMVLFKPYFRKCDDGLLPVTSSTSRTQRLSKITLWALIPENESIQKVLCIRPCFSVAESLCYIYRITLYTFINANHLCSALR